MKNLLFLCFYRYFYVLLFLIVASLFSCTSEVAGGGSDHPNEINSLAGVVSSKGSPAVSARVVLFKKTDSLNHQLYQVLDSVQTDDKGHFKFSQLSQGVYSVVAKNDSRSEKSLWNDVVLGGKDTLRDTTLEMNGVATLKGVIKGVNNLYAVFLSGTPYWVPINADGSFEFKSIPSGSVSVLTVYNQNSIQVFNIPTTLYLQPGEVKDLGTIYIKGNQSLLEDFSDEDDRISTRSLFGGGWWYLSQSSTFSPSSMSTRIYNAIVESQDSTHNRYLNFSVAGSLSNSPVLGFNIGLGWDNYISGHLQDSCLFDFSSMSAFTFKAKGSGKVIVQFASKAIQQSAIPWAHYRKEIVLTPNWTLYSILPSEIGLPADISNPSLISGITWDVAKKDIYGISFIFAENVTMSLDDIALEGIPVLTLKK